MQTSLLNIFFFLGLIVSGMAQCPFVFEAFDGPQTATCNWVFEAFDGPQTATCNWIFERFDALDITIRGYIKDSSKGSVISDSTLSSGNILIKFTSSSGVVYTATILAGGIYSVTLPKDTYTRAATLTGYTSSSTQVSISSSSTETNTANTLSLTPNIPNYTVRGYVKDGTTGKLIDDATLTSKGITIVFTSATGTTYTATMVSGSIYSITLPAGTYTRTAKLTGYSSASESVTISGGSDESTTANTIYLAQSVTGWRVILTWNGAKVKDVDAYVVLPDKSKIYYKAKTSSDGKVVLDIDNRVGDGPETVTLKNINSGVYSYWVNDYTHELGISDTEAKVTVYHGDSQAGSYTVPAGSGNQLWWHVFDINASTDKLALVNTFGSAIA